MKASDGVHDICLSFDPFEGDFGDQNDKVLQNRMVVARKVHECCHCKAMVAVGELHRYQSGRFDGDFMQWRWCALCCAAMVEASREFDEEDDPDGTLADDASMAFENRIDLHAPPQDPQDHG